MVRRLRAQSLESAFTLALASQSGGWGKSGRRWLAGRHGGPQAGQGSKLVAGFNSMSNPATLVITVRLVALPDFNKASFGVN